MKKILSVLLALVMVLSMIPVIASAAETSVKMTITGTTGTMGTKEISWTKDGVTFKNAQASSSTAIRTQDSDHYRLYVGSSVTITAPGNITKIVMTASGSSYAIAPTGSDGSVGTVSGTTITIVPKATSDTYTIAKISKQTRIKDITVTYAEAGATECEHADTSDVEAVAATCTTTGFTAGVYCNDCESFIDGHETTSLLPHTETVTDQKEVTCTEDGYTQYTCSVCGNNRKVYIDATGHSYVDGVCENCDLALPTNLAGQYYIAATRKEGNYWYMTNDVGTASTSRYQIVDSGVTTLPESIEDIVETQLFELVAVDGGYVIKTGEKYLGWSSGNSGILVDANEAKVVTIEYGVAEGSYNIHFTTGTEVRYLSLNSNADYAYYAWYTGTQINDLYLVPVGAEAEVCVHEHTTTDTEDATCEEAGSVTVTCDDCGTTVSTETIEALGHNYINGVCDKCGEEEVVVPSEATITFNDKANRTEYSTTIQVWEQNGITVTNNKGSSTSNVGDFAAPARFYKNSELIIEYPGMTKIVISGPSGQYTDAWVSSVAGATINNGVVTIELANPVDSYTIKLTGGQGRADSITVYTTKVCSHVWGEPVLTTAPACAVKGENTYTCTLCGETKTEPVASLGHVAADGFCSVCGGEFYTLATSLNEGDSVVLFNPENEVAMGVNVNSYGDKMLGVATDDATGLAVTADMAVMQVQYVNETDFYLVKDGKYLTTGATGNSLSFADEANDYSIWYMEVPFEGEDVVIITNRNAKYTNNAGVTNEQSIEFYNDAFTAYSKSTGKAFQMKLYVKAAPVPADPTIEITHISLDPTNDALGYKAATTNAPEGSTIEISLWVYETNKVTKTVAEGKALRLKNIMANNGGETIIYAKATLKDAQGNVIAESAVAETTMKDTIIAVNKIGNQLNDDQALAVFAYYEQYQTIMDAWLGDNNDIQNWG